jgi:hypothetical protein
MTTNGPAIWGGCVTRRSIRSRSRYFSQKTVTVQGGYGAVFAVQVQVLLSITRVAVQVLSEPVNYHGTVFLKKALAPLKRGYKLSRSQKTVKLYRILITCRCACPGARTITKLSRVQEQKQKL